MNKEIKLISVQQQPKQGGIKLKLFDFSIDPLKQSYFRDQLERVGQSIETSFLNFKIKPIIRDGQVNFQYWDFSFMGTENFQGKSISGILKFPPDFPINAPKFFFNPLPNGEVLQHAFIYGDNLISLPLLSHWNQKTQIIQILQVIEFVFKNPYVAIDDAPANPGFVNLPQEERDKIQKGQAKMLLDFKK